MARSQLLTLVLCTALAHASETRADQVFIEVTSPASADRQSARIAWAEVEGYVWTGESPLLDVVIAIDRAASTLLCSGVDVDGDGHVGQTSVDGYAAFLPTGPRYDPRLLSSDRHDTIGRAALAAARRFVESVDPDRTRVGIVHLRPKRPGRSRAGRGAGDAPARDRSPRPLGAFPRPPLRTGRLQLQHRDGNRR